MSKSPSPSPSPNQFESQASPDRILHTGLAFLSAKALLSAVELGVFTELAKGPADAATLRERVGVHPRGALDFFDALVALGLLRRVDGVYHNTEEAAAYLDRGKQSYLHVGSMLEMANSRMYPIWSNLTDALRTGKQQDQATNDTDEYIYDALYADEQRLQEFLASMTGMSHSANCRIATQVDWSGYKTLADMGTAQGDLAVQVLLANPHLQGIGFDLPAAAPTFTKYAADNGLQDRLRFVGGDFFTQDFPASDVFTFGHILHNWDLDRKKVLLKKAWQALPKGGAVIVYDSLIDDDRSQNAFGLLMSLNMLAVTDVGFGYTAADCKGWMAEAGFGRTWSEHLVGPDSIVVGIKE
ncbi:acetylserotonin O-methyltransferase [Streptomyces sp. MST-110588]|uniref:acetylserotonin O-methyltransferase n=1 Tax=Streptomyces sp. MST-110588 TaxID=2833628 RepID=UPI001F5E33EF|nr:acetylserotonin O-methyltransferase [Streptomyces sp. MST-110588]UNO43015.1 methyltransferase [Streptomyces sp. MST-110588]